MRLGTRLDPRAEERLRRVSGSGGDEFVSRLTEGPVRTEGDRPKADAEPLVLDDLVGAAVVPLEFEFRVVDRFLNSAVFLQRSICERHDTFPKIFTGPPRWICADSAQQIVRYIQSYTITDI